MENHHFEWINDDKSPISWTVSSSALALGTLGLSDSGAGQPSPWVCTGTVLWTTHPVVSTLINKPTAAACCNWVSHCNSRSSLSGLITLPYLSGADNIDSVLGPFGHTNAKTYHVLIYLLRWYSGMSKNWIPPNPNSNSLSSFSFQFHGCLNDLGYSNYIPLSCTPIAYFCPIRSIVSRLQALYLSHIRRGRVTTSPCHSGDTEKVASASGKSHQGKRNTKAQPVSSVIGDLVKTSRSIAHSNDFEGQKSI